MRSRRIYWFGIRAVKDMKSLEWRRTMGPRGCWDRPVGERCPSKWGLNGHVRNGEEPGMGSGEESSRPGGRKLWGGGKLSSWSWVRASLNGFSRNGVIVRWLVNSYRQPSWILSENSVDTGFVKICAVHSSLKSHRMLEKSGDTIFIFTLLGEILSCGENIFIWVRTHAEFSGAADYN